MSQLKNTTGVPVTAYATCNGNPITKSRYYFELIWLNLIDIIARVRVLNRICSNSPSLMTRLSRNPHIPLNLAKINRIKQLDVVKKSSGSHLIYTGKVSSPINKTFAPLYFMPGIRNKPLWDNNEFPWIKTLFEANYAEIIQEIRALPLPSGKTYGMKAWGTHVLFAGNIENTAVTKYCPFTTALLKKVPGFYGGHSCVSVARPHGNILRHTGEGNWTLRVQFALEIPDNRCYLEVAGEKIRWNEGKAFVFDDSYIHLVCNPTDSARTVLFFDFYHPDLTEADIAMLSKYHTSEVVFKQHTRMSF